MARMDAATHCTFGHPLNSRWRRHRHSRSNGSLPRYERFCTPTPGSDVSQLRCRCVVHTLCPHVVWENADSLVNNVLGLGLSSATNNSFEGVKEIWETLAVITCIIAKHRDQHLSRMWFLCTCSTRM